MINATISGRIGKDAETRQAGQGKVTSFSVASSHKMKGEDVTTWTDCSIWGDRGEKVAQYLKKGGFVVVSGKLYTHEHNGKTYLKLDVSDFEFGPKQNGNGQRQEREPGDDREPAPKGYTSHKVGDAAEDFPF